MEEQEAILSKYWKFHSNTNDDIGKKTLEEECRAFLEASESGDRFCLLDSNFYKHILERVAARLGGSEKSLHEMKTGFNSLEKFAVNLAKYSWRKEFHTIKLYTAFFKSKVELYLRDIDVILSILEALGYRKTGEDLELVSLREPNAEGAKRVSFQLFLVQLELQIIKEIMEEFTEVCTESKCTLEDVIKARQKTREKKNTLVYLSRKFPKRRRLAEPRQNEASSSNDNREIQNAETTETSSKLAKQSVACYHHGSTERFDISANNKEDERDVHTSGESDASPAMSSHYIRGTGHGPARFNTQFTDQDLYGATCVTEHVETGRSNASLAKLQGSDHSHTSLGTCAHDYIQGSFGHGNRHPVASDMRTPNVNPNGNAMPSLTQSSPGKNTHNMLQGDLQGSGDRMSATIKIDQGTHGFSGFPKSGGHSCKLDQSSAYPQDRVTDLSSAEGNGLTTEVNRSQKGFPSKDLTPRLNMDLQGNLKLDSSSYSKQASREVEASTPKTATRREVKSMGQQPMSNRTHGATEYVATNGASDRYYLCYNPGRDASPGEPHPKNTRPANVTTGSEQLMLGNIDRKLSSTGVGKDPDIGGEASAFNKDFHCEESRSHEGFIHGAPLAPRREDGNLEGARKDPAFAAKTSGLKCSLCEAESQYICKNCLVICCFRCRGVFDLCDAFKGEHLFKDIKKTGTTKSVHHNPTLTHQNFVRSVDKDEEWNCSRCTFLNSPENKICVMCASTRGVDVTQVSESGSTVCEHCTLHNDESAKVCVACNKSLNRGTPV